MRFSTRFLLITAVCLALPATAGAATPFTAGVGAAPTGAVGGDGTGHIVWETTDEDTSVGYCRVSPGGSACNHTLELEFPGLDNQRAGSKARVFVPAPSKVVVVGGCWECGAGVQDRTYKWTSTNNGQTFSAATLIGSGPETNGFGTWLEDANLFVGASGSHVKAAVDNGSDGVQYATGGLFVYGPEVVRLEGTSKLVVATNDLDDVKYAVYTSPVLSSVLINALGSWQIDKTLPAPEPDNSDTALNSGPNGIALTYRWFVAGDTHVGLRRFDPVTNTFGGPIYVEGPDPIDDNSLEEPDSFQDPAGRIHVVWSTDFDDGRLRYTVSDPSGAAFSVVATLARNEGFYEPEVAAGADGKGFATWTPGSTGAIRVVPLDPQAESGLKPDTTPPKVTGFDIGDDTLFPGQGTKFTFRSTEAGNAVLTIEKKFKGVKKKRKGKKVCVAAKKGKKRNCTGFKKIGQIRQKVKAGVNTIVFNGRIAGRKLKPGQYRASLVITDAAGQVSRTETIKFKVLKPKKGKRKGR
jgi:hypothetical protein